jgi:hypothetical protein
MPLREIKRKLTGGRLESIEGSGSELTFKFTACRETKAGTQERYTIELKSCRWVVGQLLSKLKEMHVRDRERIQAELARIEREVNALKVGS